MNIGIWKTICFSITTVGFLLCSMVGEANAQEGFREFDRKMVATPAELLGVLSRLHPAKHEKQVDAKRLKEIEKAGRDFLSKLSPEQQDKAWEFAEKFFRKNGADAAASKNLMQEFGLPPEMQNELAKQLRKYGKQGAGSDQPKGGDEDDPISDLLRKAREKFKKANLNEEGGAKGAVPSDRAMPVSPSIDPKAKQEGAQETQSVKDNGKERSGSQSDLEGAAKAKTKSTRRPKQVVPESPFGRPEAESANGDKIKKQANPFGTQPRPSANARNTKRGPRSEGTSKFSQQGERRKPRSSDAEIERLMKRLDGLKKQEEIQRRTSGNLQRKKSTVGEDVDWEQLIKKLAERDVGGESSNASGDPTKQPSSKSGIAKAKDLISDAFNPNSKSKSGEPSAELLKGAKPNESVGTQFDRLLVKAVDRTLNSKNEEGVSKGVGGMLGKLIERFQDQAKKKSGRSREANREPSGPKFVDRPQNRSANKERNRSQANNSSNRSNQDSYSPPELSSSSASPNAAVPDSSPSNLFEQLPDLSGVNPAHVFTFFAVVGLALFVGYLLTQSIAGNESTYRTRQVIKQVRNTTIRSPKDLVETVDMFLLTKFGIKSSWWNASLAQRVLNSGSPELEGRVDELFRDYVRARYMRADISIPDADQQRYKSTLEELSKLDIKANAKLSFAPVKPSVDATASLEG